MASAARLGWSARASGARGERRKGPARHVEVGAEVARGDARAAGVVGGRRARRALGAQAVRAGVAQEAALERRAARDVETPEARAAGQREAPEAVPLPRADGVGAAQAALGVDAPGAEGEAAAVAVEGDGAVAGEPLAVPPRVADGRAIQSARVHDAVVVVGRLAFEGRDGADAADGGPRRSSGDAAGGAAAPRADARRERQRRAVAQCAEVDHAADGARPVEVRARAVEDLGGADERGREQREVELPELRVRQRQPVQQHQRLRRRGAAHRDGRETGRTVAPHVERRPRAQPLGDGRGARVSRALCR